MNKQEIEKIVDELILEYPKQAKHYSAGKTVIGFFIGQIMKKTNGELKYATDFLFEVVKEKLSKVK